MHSLPRFNFIPLLSASSGWYLPTLTEFFPAKECLAGMNQNRGQTIFIRLRPAHDKSSFLPLEDFLIGTLLHEFTHNVHGPHDKKFYDFLDKLQNEYDEIRRGGYSGEGFFSDGKRAGTTSHNLEPALARAKAIKEAERRSQVHKVMGPAGGRTLGGTSANRSSRANIPPRDMAAFAAERRRKDAGSCGQGEDVSATTVQREVEKAAREATTLQQNLERKDGYKIVPSPNTTKTSQAVAQPSGPDPNMQDQKYSSDDSDIELLEPHTKIPRTTQSHATKGRSKIKSETNLCQTSDSFQDSLPISTSWACKACTYENVKALALACDVCSSPRYSNEKSIHKNPREIPDHSAVTASYELSMTW